MKFKLGQVVMTRGINCTITDSIKFSEEILEAIAKYRSCNWGDTCKSDSKLNDDAVKYGNDRIVAKYHTSEGDIFIITEYDRSVTTILFADEY